MREELDKKLCEKYPKLFVNRHSDVKETAMCWGFEHGDGWFHIIHHLCHLIQSHIDWKNEQKEKYGRGEGCTQVVVDQVKEKFGTLRFYYSGGDDYIQGLVQMAESMSGITCEECGSLGRVRRDGWVRVLCDEHAKEKTND